jgi:predicted nuclease of predicted toxin-antitoxin system
MKILLDENIPAKIKYDFGHGHEVSTVRDMSWLGKKNGELLGLAAFNGFDIFITLDKKLKNQQNLGKLDLKFIVLLANDNKHETIQPHVDKIKVLLQNVEALPKLTEVSMNE